VTPTVVIVDEPHWTPGAPLDLVYSVSNPLPGLRTLEWTLASARAWPGYPLSGSFQLGAGESEDLIVRANVPDTAAAGPNTLRLSLGFAGAPGQVAVCEITVRDAVAPAPSGLAIGSPRPHPARGQVNLEFAVPSAGHARFQLYDVSGRRIGESIETETAAGHHLLSPPSWKRLAPGLYLVRMWFGERKLSRRVIVTR
jgi:hypothetical protein